ncbi:hypothetical protein FZC84_00550 [Rossellomorea vietnamensis]|uniref:Uncharacterized protein n=1 Tax=Rossellomorea vietnamensis TaxID=218284 RepID=A0A5D4MHI4_9BACI|nr:hypothetical protein [Rossellomorea vietnamensis]TYS01193.1 hypothetical protein FZC84_00550 [Rossellomorea vietnamensis]
MKLYMIVLLRSLLFVSLAVMVYDVVWVEQQFELLGRGYIDGFSTNVNNLMGQIFMILTAILVILNAIQMFSMKKKKQAKVEDYILPEYDASDERTVEITGRAVRFAFGFVLLFSFLILGSYMFIPTYFLDFVWYPMFTTASIPIAGLIVYLISFKVLYSR